MIFEGLTKVRTDLESTLKDVHILSRGFWLCILFCEKLQIMFLFSYLFMAWVLRVFLFGWKTCVMIEVYLSKGDFYMYCLLLYSVLTVIN